jgi:hypothetical protein
VYKRAPKEVFSKISDVQGLYCTILFWILIYFKFCANSDWAALHYPTN